MVDGRLETFDMGRVWVWLVVGLGPRACPSCFEVLSEFEGEGPVLHDRPERIRRRAEAGVGTFEEPDLTVSLGCPWSCQGFREVAQNGGVPLAFGSGFRRCDSFFVEDDILHGCFQVVRYGPAALTGDDGSTVREVHGSLLGWAVFA